MLFVPTLGTINTKMYNFLQTINSNHKVRICTTSRVLIHAARNFALKKAHEEKHDFLIMMDEDNPPNRSDFIDLMVWCNRPVVSGVVRLRNRKDDLNICRRELSRGIYRYVNYKELSTIPEDWIVDNCGSWLICLKMDVVKDMLKKYPLPFENKFTRYIKKKDWFKEFWPSILGEESFETNKDGWLILQGRELSEDYLFFERVRSLGYSIFVDKRATCSHLSDYLIEV